jgi:hypothetical protein
MKQDLGQSVPSYADVNREDRPGHPQLHVSPLGS